ncbi:type II secretion system F family protein [Rouxiella sp. WC2420]|uniref:Type II secretion system F family protein n=1 Tax=Rouxiella sp. WC2420 TaxID=3234145 RepID=A0AB39VN20_9GAMM
MSQSDLYLYIWQAVDDSGKLLCGESLLPRSQEVFGQLLQKGLQPIVLKKSLKMGKGYWKNKERIAFVRQLATLLQTGLPLTLSLELLASDHPLAGWRCVLADLVKKVNEGQPLSSVMKEYPQVFPPIYAQIISIGELTGQLDSCCAQLAT